jgi:hypothetical protein
MHDGPWTICAHVVAAGPKARDGPSLGPVFHRQVEKLNPPSPSFISPDDPLPALGKRCMWDRRRSIVHKLAPARTFFSLEILPCAAFWLLITIPAWLFLHTMRCSSAAVLDGSPMLAEARLAMPKQDRFQRCPSKACPPWETFQPP